MLFAFWLRLLIVFGTLYPPILLSYEQFQVWKPIVTPLVFVVLPIGHALVGLAGLLCCLAAPRDVEGALWIGLALALAGCSALVTLVRLAVLSYESLQGLIDMVNVLAAGSFLFFLQQLARYAEPAEESKLSHITRKLWWGTAIFWIAGLLWWVSVLFLVAGLLGLVPKQPGVALAGSLRTEILIYAPLIILLGEVIAYSNLLVCVRELVVRHGARVEPARPVMSPAQSHIR
jgi:hypothetical protein